MSGIMPSVAAQIVDNAFMGLGYSPEQMEVVNYNDKIKSYCSQPQLDAVINFIRGDKTGGLPSIGCGIEFKYVKDVSRDSTYGLLVNRVCRYAEHRLIP